MVRETGYSEIVAMEQELMAGGMPVEEVRCMCDLHSQVTRDVMVQISTKSVPPGHPADTFRRGASRSSTDFRSGKQNVAEFWINFEGRFVHIRYFAVRDGKGLYLGTLEVTQDLTHVRKLEGERRLLEYGTPATA
jgi:DUF438 domain-containing protein